MYYSYCYFKKGPPSKVQLEEIFDKLLHSDLTEHVLNFK